MTEQPLQATKKDPIVFSRKGNEDMRQYATYAAYNTSHETIILPKNQLVGQYQLILQPNEGVYQQELSGTSVTQGTSKIPWNGTILQALPQGPL